MLYREFADGSAATASMASIALRFAPTLSEPMPPTALFSRSHFRVIPERNAWGLARYLINSSSKEHV
jgi:hypothetical protein